PIILPDGHWPLRKQSCTKTVLLTTSTPLWSRCPLTRTRRLPPSTQTTPIVAGPRSTPLTARKRWAFWTVAFCSCTPFACSALVTWQSEATFDTFWLFGYPFVA